ncbi:MAG: glycosyltransferase family 4 protein [Planctomycetota bacterium]|jgi:glycosyltransferase involved in cell wall biosynthesis
MKIALIIERVDIALGGAERSVMELSTTLSSHGHEVDILAAKGQTNAKNIYLLCSSKTGKRTNFFAFSKAIKKHISRKNYDIIHSVLPLDFCDVYQPRGGCYVEAIRQNAASYENKFLSHYKRMTSFANWRRSALALAERKLCRNDKGPTIAALSNYVAKQFREHYGVSEERIEIIPNGIRVNKYREASQADQLRSQILFKLGLKEADNPIFFLFVANNFRLKGLAPLIRALKLAYDKYSARNAYLVLAGHGRSYKYRLLARKFGVHKKIVFLGPVRHIHNAFSITDVAVLPTFYDPSSRFILEALAAEKPVITTRLNGAIDLFEDGRHGIVVDHPQNTGALARAIGYYTDINNISAASRAIQDDNIEEKVTIRRAATKLEALYERILERKDNK